MGWAPWRVSPSLVAGGSAVYIAATVTFARSIVAPMWVGLRGAGAAR